MALIGEPEPRALNGTVLVLRALGVGDLLTAVPALRALRRAFADRRIVLAAPEHLRPLADLIDAVDLLHPTAGLGALDWHGEAPAVAVNLHGEGPESTRDLLYTGPEELITHGSTALPGISGPRWRPDLHEVDRWCRLLRLRGIPTDPTDLFLDAPSSPDEYDVVVHPGAASAARRWPAERFARVARALAADGREVVVTGDRREIALAKSVAAGAGLEPSRVLAGRTDLGDLAAVVGSARLVLCGDTGMAHLATAFGTPSVVLFGPVAPALWGPPPHRRQHRALWAGRHGDPHGEQPDPGLLELDCDTALEAARELLAEGDFAGLEDHLTLHGGVGAGPLAQAPAASHSRAEPPR
ncbi:glycosyltransferase family 9 protein [Glycomyces albidus]|uniref:Glycosyltransferase family 9 protein n=1 Tax=Glycomyces albidus TaxID=2656774 RepID=A0A6L5G7S3_9ACTN|nr:glycosyltransferase family 9 protein [Glycomyces albidus]MQM25628.1 glycosyltransferase family 9 protein [Glycomyces albidus]